ncbi:EmrB/QacA family drug resistance transporter, partial [Streptomyces sp. MCAF7]
HDEVARALSLLGCRKGRKQVYEDIAERAGLDLGPAVSWMLLRMTHYGAVAPYLLAGRSTAPPWVITEAARQIEERGLGARDGVSLVPTEEGRRVAERLYRARGESLAELLGDWWSPDRPTDLMELVRVLNRELCGSDAEQPGGGDSSRPGPPRGA